MNLIQIHLSEMLNYKYLLFIIIYIYIIYICYSNVHVRSITLIKNNANVCNSRCLRKYVCVPLIYLCFHGKNNCNNIRKCTCIFLLRSKCTSLLLYGKMGAHIRVKRNHHVPSSDINHIEWQNKKNAYLCNK